MAKNNKRYFWLKLKADFFTQKEIKLLRKVAGGDTHTIIYLKMLLVSLKHEGKIFYEGIGNNFAEEVALEIDEEIENVTLTMNFLASKGLLEYSEENDELYLNDIASLVGSESESANRVRLHRKNKSLQCNAIPLQSNKDVTTEKELDLEKELELEKHIVEQKHDEGKTNSYKTIISYLNDKAGTSFRYSGKATQTKINARLNEGFTIDDFKNVIDNKVAEWGCSDKYAKYLRPETLFGTKFESYLNQGKLSKNAKGTYTRSEDDMLNNLPF